MAEPNEKTANSSVSPPSTSSTESISDLDKAYNFIQNVNNAGDIDTDSVDIKAIRRRVDFRLIPIMLLCYIMQTLDKVNINVCSSLYLVPQNFELKSTSMLL